MKKVINIFAFAVCTFMFCSEARANKFAQENGGRTLDPVNNITVLENWENMEKELKKMANSAIKMILPIMMENFNGLKISKECVSSSLHLITGIKNIKPWAIKFLDSSGKFFDGMLTGSFSSFGSYDECLDIKVKSNRNQNIGKILFEGQYCMIDIRPKIPPRPRILKLEELPEEFKNFSLKDTVVAETAKFMNFFYVGSFRQGLCVPSSCSVEDINKVVLHAADSLSLNLSVYRCEVKEENKYTPLIIGVISFYSGFGLLMFVGSIIDIYGYYRKVSFKNLAIRILVAFSLFTNFRNFFDPSEPKSNYYIRCLSGVRFFGMAWIVLMHTYMENVSINMHGLQQVKTTMKDFAFQAVLNGSVGVDTFFVVGGLLVGYLIIIRYHQENKTFNVWMYIFRRLLRIIPSYSVILAFCFIISLFGSGPMWHDKTDEALLPCYNYWWTHFLFINNLYSVENMCLPHTWYIAADFQLYVFALIIVLPMLRWPKIGICLAFLTILASIVYAGVVSYIREYPPTVVLLDLDKQAVLNYLGNFTFKPFMHAGPYAMGILAGFFLATRPNLKMSCLVQILGWSVAFVSSFSILYGTNDWFRGTEPPFASSILYASFNRTAWCVGIVWMLVCCATGHGGFINYILSLKVFDSLSRLSYLAYLIHPLVQKIMLGNIRTRIQPDQFMFIWYFLGHLCVSLALAFIVHLLVEVPFATIERIFLSRPEKKSEDIKSFENFSHRTSISNNTDKTEDMDYKFAVYKS